ncbi:MAG TPA: hypothetical protein VIQ03_10075, partial [Gammaproteobacteria bacterium]
ARFIRKNKESINKTRIIQVFKKGSDGELAANGFTNTWKTFNEKFRQGSELINIDNNQPASLENALSNQALSIILIWDGMDETTSHILSNTIEKGGTDMVFMSSRLLQENYSLISDELREASYITYPYSVPGDKDRHISTLKTWLEIKGIPITNLKIQSEMYFLGWMLSDALSGIKSEFYREYFLERIEMMKDHTHTISVYPRLSLGPDQRYASKGCYIVQLEKGDSPKLQVKSNWVIH